MDLSNFKLFTDVFAIRCIDDNVLIGQCKKLYLFLKYYEKFIINQVMSKIVT